MPLLPGFKVKELQAGTGATKEVNPDKAVVIMMMREKESGYTLLKIMTMMVIGFQKRG